MSEIVRTIEETGNDRLMVGFNRRFSPLLEQMKEEWGTRLGPHMIHYRVNAGPLEKGSWYSQSATEGSRFVGEGGHFIDTVSWWLDEDPVRVTAAATAGDQDNLSAVVNYADGSVATISYLTDGDPRVPKERIEIFGEGKVACFENFSQFTLWQNGRSTTRRSRTLDKGQNAELDAFVLALKRAGRMPIGLHSLLATTRQRWRRRKASRRTRRSQSRPQSCLPAPAPPEFRSQLKQNERGLVLASPPADGAIGGRRTSARRSGPPPLAAATHGAAARRSRCAHRLSGSTFAGVVPAIDPANLPQDARDRLLMAAEDVLKGRWSVFGSRTPSLATDPDWFVDARTGRRAPRRRLRVRHPVSE